MGPIWCQLLLPFPLLFVFLLEFREVSMSDNFPIRISEYYEKIVDFEKVKPPPPPKNETKEFVYEEEKCGNLWNRKVSDWKLRYYKTKKLTYYVKIFLDGCFFCPYMTDYKITFMEIRQVVIPNDDSGIRQHSQIDIPITGTGFSIFWQINRLPDRKDTTYVFLVIKHTCSDFEQIYWQYIIVDGWTILWGDDDFNNPLIYPTKRIELCTRPSEFCRSGRLDPFDIEKGSTMRTMLEEGSKCTSGLSCFTYYNGTDPMKTKRNWEETRNFKMEKAKVEFEEKIKKEKEEKEEKENEGI